MSDATITQINEKMVRALREVRRQVEFGEIEGMDYDVLKQIDDAISDHEAMARTKGARNVPADGGPLPGYHHYEVHLPGFVNAATSKSLLLIVEATNAAAVRALVPDYSQIDAMPELQPADNVDFILPLNANQLRAHAHEATAKNAPADAVSIQAMRLTRMMRTLCNTPDAPSAEDRANGRKQAQATEEAVHKHLVTRAQIKAHDDRLMAKEEVATCDDYSEVIDLTGVKIPGSLADRSMDEQL